MYMDPIPMVPLNNPKQHQNQFQVYQMDSSDSLLSTATVYSYLHVLLFNCTPSFTMQFLRLLSTAFVNYSLPVILPSSGSLLSTFVNYHYHLFVDVCCCQFSVTVNCLQLQVAISCQLSNIVNIFSLNIAVNYWFSVTFSCLLFQVLSSVVSLSLSTVCCCRLL